MGSLYKLITKTNLKSPTLAFPLVMPLVFILLYSVTMSGGMTQIEVDATVASFFVALLSITTMQSGIMGFGINFISIKKSVLLRRIGATELKKMDVILAVMLFGLTLYLISFIWLFVATTLFAAMGIFYSAAETAGGPDVVAGAFAWMQQISWAKLLLVTVVMLYTSYSLGMLFTTISKDDQMYMGIGMLYFFMAGFVGGLMFPGQTPEWMNALSLIIPHGYIDSLYDWAAGAQVVNQGGHIFSIYDGNTLVSISQFEFAMGFIVPVVFGTACLGASAKLLKFD